MTGHYLFVYGSLRRPLRPPSLQALMGRYCDYIGMAWTQGRLYEISGYPGLVACDDGADKVYGELYRLAMPEPVFQALDVYEECAADFPRPHEYVRKRQPVFSLDGDVAITAWLYAFNRAVDGLRLISSGDYCLDER